MTTERESEKEKVEMVEAMVKYMMDAIKHQERLLFSRIKVSTDDDGERAAFLRNARLSLPIIFINSENHWNNAYMALLYPERDAMVTAMFGHLTGILNHSPVCLINILARMTLSCHAQLHRSHLNACSEQEYLDSVDEVLAGMFKDETRALTTKAVSHSCAGPKENFPYPADGRFFTFRVDM